MKILLLLLFLRAGSGAKTPDNERLTSYLDEEFSFLKKAMQKIENANDEILKNVHNIAEKGNTVSSTDSKTENEDCKDRNHKCDKYVKKGYCEKKPEKMKNHCERSCNMCDGGTQEEKTVSDDCKDKSMNCAKYLKKGYCQRSVRQMKKRCTKSCGFCISKKAETKAEERGKEEERVKPKGNDESKDECVDTSHKCMKYLKKGFCQKFEEKLMKICAKTCGFCTEGESSEENETSSGYEGENNYMSTGSPISIDNTWDMYTDSKLIVATSEEIFEYDFLSQSWKRHKVTSGPKAIYFVNDSLTWVSEMKVGIYNGNFEANTLMKLQDPVVPIAVDRDSGLAYLNSVKRNKSNLFILDVEKRKMLKNIPLPSNFNFLNGMARKKKLQMLGIKRGRLVEMTMCLAKHQMYHTKLRLPIDVNATLDPFKDNCVLYVSNLHLMEFCVNAKSKKLAAIPGPIKSMQVNEESILLVGHADVYIYNRSSSEVKTLPRPANLSNNFIFGLIYKKPENARSSEEHMDGSGSGDENGTSYEYDDSVTYGSSGDQGSSVDYGTSGDYGSSGNYAKSETYGTDTTRKEKRNKEATVKDKTKIQRHLTKDKMIRTKDLRAQLVRNNGDLGPKVMDDRGMKNGMIFRRDRMSRKITRDARSGHMAMDGEGTELVNDGRMDSDPTTIVMNGEGFGSMEQRPMSAELPADGVMGIRKESMRHGRRSSRVGFKPKSSEKFQRAGPYP